MSPAAEVQRLAAFTVGGAGGNPAGVLLADRLPDAAAMQSIAAEIGYSETAFVAPLGPEWRVRYFAPQMEVPFCGHATIALGAALAGRFGPGSYALRLNDDVLISVEGHQTADGYTASLASPPTQSEPASGALVDRALRLFGYGPDDLDARMPPAVAKAGATHLILALKSRERLSAMRYDMEAGRRLMEQHSLTTVSLIHAERPDLFHARNPFAAGGIYEDPATGAAAAALSGYLRDIGWPHGGVIEILQGQDMGQPSRLRAEITDVAGGSIRISGSVRVLDSAQ